MSDNLKLWDSVEKTNPAHTKKANVRGNNITAIAPQQQIKNATEQFGIYGKDWGFRSISFDYSIVELTGIVVFHGLFFFPQAEFPITSSISAYRDNAQTKPDADFAKKVETDALTKALSKLGFNADVFMGLFDDHKYVQMMNEEFTPVYKVPVPIIAAIAKNDYKWVCDNWDGLLKMEWPKLPEDVTDNLNKIYNKGL